MVKNKRTYHYQKDHSHDMSYENEVKYEDIPNLCQKYKIKKNLINPIYMS